MRIAVIADIHGNVLALEAVLADIKRQGADLTVDLGDCVSGPLWPRETMDILAALDLPTVRGNHERQLQAPDSLLGPSDADAARVLTTAEREALGALPLTRTVADRVLLCHGTPEDDATPLLERILPEGGFTLTASSEIESAVAAIPADLVLCGHTHTPRLVSAKSQRGTKITIVNPGSVGLPAFEDDGLHFGCGSPHARYAIVTRRPTGWQVAHIALDYDWTRASRKASEAGRMDWARGLARGDCTPQEGE